MFMAGFLFGFIICYIMMDENSVTELSEQELCSHGVEWDECPDCCH